MRVTLEEQLIWLDSMASWPDGWNGYNALAPRKELIDKAKTWLTSFHELVANTWQSPTFVTGTGDGGVSIEWICGPRRVSIDIDEEEISYLKSWGPNCTTEMEDGDASLPGFLTVWQWLLQDMPLDRRV